jgi:hypothetical protein
MLKKRSKRLLKQRLYKLCPIPVDQAQRSKVFRQKKFLSEQEILSVCSIVKNLDIQSYTNNPSQDIDDMGYAVHTTSYINTDNLFSSKLRWLKDRIFPLIWIANERSHWGFDTTSEKINIRVAEYHEMEVNGSLRDHHHYDVGSLITVDIMLSGVWCV